MQAALKEFISMVVTNIDFPPHPSSRFCKWQRNHALVKRI
jgi:hypothetical protein